MKQLLALAVFTMVLTGCASRASDFPPLTPRQGEKDLQAALEEPAAAEVARAPGDPILGAQLDALVSEAESSRPGFRAAADAAWPIVRNAHGTARGSEAWVAAQMAISRVESARAPVKRVLAELDEKRRLILFGPPSEDEARIASALVVVERLDAEQAEEMGRLQALVAR